MAPLPLPIRTSRMVLRAPVASDVDAVYSALHDTAMARYVSHRPNPYTRKDALEFVEVARRRMRTGELLSLVGVDRESQELSAAVGLFNIDWKDQHAEVGYWVPRKRWGNGLATEAVTAVCAAVFHRLKIHRIEASVVAQNVASIRVLRRAGFVKEGTRREAVRLGSGWSDSELYGLLKS